jgi:putative pyrroloquinoline-quinone binding quinoprotein
VSTRDDSDRQSLTMMQEQRARARSRPAVALSVAVVVAVAAVVAGIILRGAREPRPAAAPGPRVVADVEVGAALAPSGRPGFGAMWLSDSSRGELLRVELGTRRVTRRIPIGSGAAVATGAGAVWALPRGPGYQGGPLLRIGPATGRTIARVALRTPAGGPFRGGSLVVGGRLVWVLGAMGAVAVDPAGDRVVAEIRLGGDYTVSDAFVLDGELWLTRGDRSVTRFDARTGRRLGRLHWRTDGFLVPFAAELIAVTKDSVALVDPATGRPAWRRRVGTDLRDAQVAGGHVFVVGADGPATARDRLWEIDARSGRIVGTLTVPEFGPLGMVTAGRAVWLLSAGGRAVVVEP